MSLARRLFKSSLSRTTVMMINMAVSFFMLPFLVSRLGDRWYGIWTIIGSLVSYYYLVDLGLAAAVTRFVTQYIATRNHQSANKIINTSLVIYSVMGLVIILLTVLISALAPYVIHDSGSIRIVRVVIVIVGLNMALEFPFKSFAGIIAANVRYDLLSYSHIIVLVLNTSLTVFFVKRGHGILTLALIGLICSQISNVMFYAISRHLFPQMKIDLSSFSKEESRGLFRYSIWAFLDQIGGQLKFRIDSFVIAVALSATHVTHYFIGARLVDIFLTLANRITNIMTPVFTRFNAEGNTHQMRSTLLFMTKINTIIAAFGGGVIVILGKPFIARWMGGGYLDAVPVLVTLAVAIAFEIVNSPNNNVLYAIARHDFLALVTLVEGLANLGLSIVLVRSYGILGVALGTAIPLIASRAIIIPIFTCRKIQLPLRRYYGNIAGTLSFTSLYLALFYLVVRNTLIVPEYRMLLTAIVACVPLYAISILFVAFSQTERTQLKALFV